jgi:hypothetical protein
MRQAGPGTCSGDGWRGHGLHPAHSEILPSSAFGIAMTPFVAVPAVCVWGGVQRPQGDTTGVQRNILRLEEAWRMAQRNTDTVAFVRLLAPALGR